jgi:GDP-L-fucose synthase
MPELLFPLAGKKVWVAGHRGMVGSALVRRLAREGCDILTADRKTLDLRRQRETEDWLAAHKPDAAFIAAAKVGGIAANAASPGEFLYDNLIIEANAIEAARKAGVAKLVFLGSSCIYPKLAPQPIPEDALLSGPLEPTNQWYAIAKISGLMMCRAYRKQYGCDFISAMPSNLYGPQDNFDLETGHVLAALIRKAHDARESKTSEFVVWGSGKPLREFIHVDDCADALVFLMQHYSGAEHVNIGSGKDLPIIDLARLVADIVGFTGRIVLDPTRPDGTPRKLVDISKLAAMGWHPRIELRDGIADAYKWYRAHK